MLVPLRTIALSTLCSLVPGCFSDPKDDEGTADENDEDGTEGNDEESDDEESDDSGADESDSEESGESDDGTTGTGTDEVPTCQDYCDILMDHCQGGFAQFSTMAACLAVCEVWPPGEYGTDLGNSVSCRYFHAINAGEDPEGSCHNAGPAGSGVCGGLCENFCFMQAQLCIGDQEQYSNTATCVEDCNTFPTGGSFNTADADEDSFNCRLKHLTYASLDPITHCPHIVSDSATCN